MFLVYHLCCGFFFFSSRRRHTRCLSDWSSDVCSSDLPVVARERVSIPVDERVRVSTRPSNRRAPESTPMRPPSRLWPNQIGRASCRERVSRQEVYVSVKKEHKRRATNKDTLRKAWRE